MPPQTKESILEEMDCFLDLYMVFEDQIATREFREMVPSQTDRIALFAIYVSRME